MKLNFSSLATFSAAVKPLHLDRSLYYFLLVTAGVFSGSLLWNIYKVMYPSILVVPEANLPSLSVDQPDWGQWLDIAASQPPKRQKPVVKKEPPPPKQREINLKINLIGIFGGVAIMSVDGGNLQVYLKGEPVKDDIVLAEIKLNSIVLSVEGVEKEYSMPVASQIINQLSNNANLNQTSAIQPVTEVNQANIATNKQQITFNKQTVKKTTPKVRAQINVVKKQIQDQPLSAVTLGDFELTRNHGQLGVKVKSFKYRDVLIGLGLQPNDTVLSVNGLSIQQLARDPRAVNSLLKENSFQVLLIRGGRRITVPVKW